MNELTAIGLALLSSSLVTFIFMGIGMIKQHFSMIMLNQILLGHPNKLQTVQFSIFRQKRNWRYAAFIVWGIAFAISIFLIWPKG